MTTMWKIIFLIFFPAVILKLSLAEIYEHNSNKNVFKGAHKNIIPKWEFELDEKLEYPRGDKQKLSLLTKLWSAYYKCCGRVSRSVTSLKRLPAVAEAAYEQAIARLPCGLCLAPDDPAVTWRYSPVISPQLSSASLVYDERTVVEDDGSLTIHNVRREHAGVYMCAIGHSAGGIVALEVVGNSEPYDVVKPATSHGPYPTPPHHFNHQGLSLTAYTSWSPWSECSVCGRVGRRRKYGICFIKHSSIPANKTYGIHENRSNRNFTKNEKLLRILLEFPKGLPCRSRMILHNLRESQVLAKRKNEIMIGLCKVPCDKGSVFEVRSSGGTLLERANNTRGIYSLSQRLPAEPLPPVSETVYAANGEKYALTCPGVLLRDIPVNWRIGTQALVPRDIDKSSEGRVHLNARDNLVFTQVTYTDANLYSCWQRDVLSGTVKLEVWDECPYRSRYVTLLASLLAAGAVLRVCDRVLRNKRRRDY